MKQNIEKKLIELLTECICRTQMYISGQFDDGIRKRRRRETITRASEQMTFRFKTSAPRKRKHFRVIYTRGASR